MDDHDTAFDVPLTGPEVFRTKGVRHNRKRSFPLNLSGDEIYRTEKILQDLAVESRVYMQVRECVLLCERIREEARRHGY